MKILVEKTKVKTAKIVLVAAFLMILLSSLYNVSNISLEPLTNVTVELHSKSSPIKQGDRTTLQVLVYDKDFLPIENVTIQIHLKNSGETIEEKMLYLENGLYQSTVQFFSNGIWDATLYITKGNNKIVKKFSVNVEK